jgi:hypothetical protein
MEQLQYRSALRNTRDAFANLAEGVYTAGREGNAAWPIHDEDTEADVQIVYNLSDLYIAGFVVKDLGFSFKGKGNLFAAPGMGGNFQFTEDYASMGMDRNAPWSVTLDNVTFDLKALSSLTPDNVKKFDGKTVARIIVAFAEALRFADIEQAVVKGMPFDPKTALDWKVRTANAISGTDTSVKIRKK